MPCRAYRHEIALDSYVCWFNIYTHAHAFFFLSSFRMTFSNDGSTVNIIQH